MYIRVVLMVLYTLYVVMIYDATRSEVSDTNRRLFRGGAVNQINRSSTRLRSDASSNRGRTDGGRRDGDDGDAWWTRFGGVSAVDVVVFVVASKAVLETRAIEARAERAKRRRRRIGVVVFFFFSVRLSFTVM